jgi:hypothetical protein
MRVKWCSQLESHYVLVSCANLKSGPDFSVYITIFFFFEFMCSIRCVRVPSNMSSQAEDHCSIMRLALK